MTKMTRYAGFLWTMAVACAVGYYFDRRPHPWLSLLFPAAWAGTIIFISGRALERAKRRERQRKYREAPPEDPKACGWCHGKGIEIDWRNVDHASVLARYQAVLDSLPQIPCRCCRSIENEEARGVRYWNDKTQEYEEPRVGRARAEREHAEHMARLDAEKGKKR